MLIRSIETLSDGHLVVVRVRTADGRAGVGQVPPTNVDLAEEVLHRQVAPYAIGQDADDIDGLYERCRDDQAKFLGSYLSRALAGIDTALWDLRAKRAGRSVAALLGADRARAIPVYASYLGRDATPEEVVARLRQARDEHGYRAFKVKIGKRRGHGADQWPGRTPAPIAELRRGLGDGVELLADANSCYAPAEAIEVGRMLQDHGFRQFEEPCPHQELEWTAEVAAALDIDVCGGEQDNDLAQFRRMLALHAVDVVQPDVGHAGGFTVARRVAALAAAANKRCQPHAGNRSMVLLFGLHLFATLANPGPFVECAVDPSPRDTAAFAPALTVEDGHFRLPDGPGWGVELDPAWEARARRRASADEAPAGALRRLTRAARRRLGPRDVS